MPLSITPLSETIGAEITGLDLCVCAVESALAQVRAALRDHLVIVIRDQRLDPRQLLAALRLFGETMEQHLTSTLMPEHPEIAVLDSRKMPPDKEGQVIPFGARDWHTDHTNHPRPPKLTALYAVKLPSEGGDTSFANMHVAYDCLGADEQARLGQLRAVNKIEDFAYISDEARAKFAARPVHPLIRTHPDTGKRALYVHPGKLERIQGMEPEESRRLVNELVERVITPANTYRHRWRIGDLLLCDNRAVLHRAHRDYRMADGRVMHRVILRGEVPV
ncbi:MAG: hypothetical protein GKR94_25370 [Gammaproteobacteria bacterium]|nr:hypothetical protein [Gammaproteobacteria bacterium]